MMLKGATKCPLCDCDKAKISSSGEGLNPLFDCPRCGEFIVNERTFYSELFVLTNEKYLISGFTRESKETHRKPPVLLPNNIQDIIDQAPDNISGKIDKILVNLSGMTPFPGKAVLIIEHLDYPLGYCKNEEEFAYFIKYLMDASLLMQPDTSSYRLTVKAWDRIEALRRSGPFSKQVFVAMNFDKEFNGCYENAIKRAIEETHYKPYRIDREEHVDRVDDKILSEIKRSKFIIAEFTGQKHGVYFEAGYALGLGIPVVWTCHEDEITGKKLHFDTRQFNHIAWTDETDLKEKLVNRIRVLIGENK